jgi:RNA polymerase sigma-70 factor (ECF subfamily)
MNDDRTYIELVRQAQLGDRDSLNNLAELVRGRLYAYVYRIILHDDIAQDIVQESMMEMVRMLGTLHKAESFWPWLRSIAFHKICHFYTTKKNHPVITTPDLQYNADSDDWEKSHQGLANLLGQELRQIILKAMQQLNPQHRMVLNMRCYEKMEYSQIAKLTGRTEMATRVLFHRAKKALFKQLSRRGLQRGFLLSALVLFAKMTAPTEAAAAQVSVTAATINVGLKANLLAMTTGETAVVTIKAAVIPLVAAGGFLAGSMVPTSWVDTTAKWANKAAAVVREKWSGPPVTIEFEKIPVNKSGEEYWYYYPDKADESVMIRLAKYDSKGALSDCWLQNEQANYYFDKSDNTIYINNHRMFNPDLSVHTLPADDTELRGFLSKAQGKQSAGGYVYGDKTGLLVIEKRSQNQERPNSKILYHHNVPQEEYFRYNWPQDTKFIDKRDDMHRWGWTYFSISGQIDDRQVSGIGRIPFTYAASKKYPPWLRLQIDNGLKIEDGINGACVYRPNSKAPEAYAAYSFFKGLIRPWSGLHSIDIIRRDAAREKLHFETKYTPDDTKAEVVITKKLEDQHLQANYIIDLETDVVDEITCTVRSDSGQTYEGRLKFDYLRDIDRLEYEFVAPKQKIHVEPQQQSQMLWFTRLAKGKL